MTRFLILAGALLVTAPAAHAQYAAPYPMPQLAPMPQMQMPAPMPQVVPGGGYHPPQIAPNGSYVSGGNGVPQIAPDGSYVSGTPTITPSGRYVGR